MKLQHWANGKLVVDIAFYSSKRSWCVLIRACLLIMLNMVVDVSDQTLHIWVVEHFKGQFKRGRTVPVSHVNFVEFL